MAITCDWGTAKFGCGQMGITAGCTDIYGAGTTCNWIDITDVPDGIYTFVARTNWDQDPDGLGHHETDYNNNWSQTCIDIDRSSGSTTFSFVTNCDPYIDCLGQVYGSAQLDCEGVCNGGTLMGDLDASTIQDQVDAREYVDRIIGNDITAQPCTDLNDDGAITVYDAALISSCYLYGIGHVHAGGVGTNHDHCNFPTGMTNIFDTVEISIEDVNFSDQYIDVAIRNPLNHVLAYEFDISGATIMSVESLVDTLEYP